MSPLVVRAPLVVVTDTFPWADTSSVSPESPMVEAPPAWMVMVWLEAVASMVPLVVTAPAAVMATLPASDSRFPLQVTVPLLVASMVRAASEVTAARAMLPAASMSTVLVEAVAWIAPRAVCHLDPRNR